MKRWIAHSADDVMRCSFCQKSQDTVGKLISSPSDSYRTLICDECVAVCAAIIEDDSPMDIPDTLSGQETVHPLLNHPRAGELMEAIETWVREESLGKDASEEINEVRKVARAIAARNS